MSHITNQYGLPQVLVDAVVNDPYNPAPRGEKYVTVTQLANPPQLVRLMWKHGSEIVEDVSDRIWSLLGTSVHSVIERAAEGNDHYVSEERLYREFEGWHIGGQLDIYNRDTGELFDVKVTSVFSGNPSKPVKASWRRQVNLLAWLLRHNGYQVNRAYIVAILRDWQRSKAIYNNQFGEYPNRPAAKVNVPLYDDESIEMFVRAQLAELDAEVPRPCSDDERWRRGGNYAVMRADEVRWAVMQPGKKRATKIMDNENEARMLAMEMEGAWVEERQKKASRRAVQLFPTYEEAEEFVAKSKGQRFTIEGREAEYTRCQSYCAVRAFCEQANSDGQVYSEPADHAASR